MNKKMSENTIKHLEFIQNVITRMNTNSFQIKTFTITIVAALLAVFASSKSESLVILTIVPSLLFWFLDAYYLQQERKFRAVYENVAGIKKDIKINDFEMPINKFTKKQFSYRKVLFSKTIFLFHGITIFILLLLALLLL